MASIVTTRQGEYSLLEVALPGREAEAAGVILHDPEGGLVDLRLRRDWDEIAEDEDAEVLELLEDDLRAKSSEMGAEAFFRQLEATLSNTVRIGERAKVLLGDFDATLNRLYQRLVPATVMPYVTHLPVYELRAAAGSYSEQMQVDENTDEWVEPPANLRLSEGMFVATVTGHSMEPRIPAGSRCIFRRNVTGSREGRLVLVVNREESDEGGERFTIKRYRSEKSVSQDGWQHARIIMEPLNPAYETWELDPEAGEQEKIEVVGEFVDILDDGTPG